ncbi:MAG: hypothetical protein M3Z08_14880 [Chloroflexota bacterium]|nr:hypothetical protein [Chloroflexota bacterium]
MHRKLQRSAQDEGTPESIASKLTFNQECFGVALRRLALQSINADKYRPISALIEQAYMRCRPLFRHRHARHAIKRCHGDLKVSNLWVRPASRYLRGLKLSSPRLLAHDCIDFNPEFYHIDTLSDIAMLAIDIEMHLGNRTDRGFSFQQAEGLSRHFLNTYLREAREDRRVAWELLNYYIVEKAMVCAYVQLMHESYPAASLRYLDLGLAHAQQL